MSWALLATQGIRNELLITVAGRILRDDGDTMVKPGDTWNGLWSLFESLTDIV